VQFVALQRVALAPESRWYASLQLAAELHDPPATLAFRKTRRVIQKDRAPMIAGNNGEKDLDVLRRLRQFGLHPAVRVFENQATPGWAEQSLKRLVIRATDRPMLRLVIGSRTA
jgi:hypothetical protein